MNDGDEVVNELAASDSNVWVWPDDPRSWAILGDPDSESVRAYRTFRTYMVRWHRSVCMGEEIMHFEDHSDVFLDDGVILRSFGRILVDDGTDVTHEYVRSTSRNM